AKRRAAAEDSMRGVLSGARAQGRDYLTPAESVRMDHLLGVRDTFKREFAELERQLGECQREVEQQRLDHAAELDVRETGVPRPYGSQTASFQVGRNERTYHPGADREAGGEPGSAFL